MEIKMIVLNFSHPLTEDQKREVAGLVEYPEGSPAAMTDQEVEREIVIPSQMDNGQPFIPQLYRKFSEIPLTEWEWEHADIVVVPPAYAPACAVVIAMLHEKMGDFPKVIRIRPVAGAIPPRFEVAEVMRVGDIYFPA